MKQKIIVVLGPTATGKSDLAVSIAKKYNGEIISADSRQVYKGLDIGSGKITHSEMKGVPHHLLDVVKPQTIFSVEKFKKLAEKAVADIGASGKIPIIAGGTGFYIDALVYDVKTPKVEPNKSLRTKLEKMSLEKLQSQLKKLDQERYDSIDQKNKVRLIRAIEIVTTIGKVPKLQKNLGKYDVLFIGIDWPDEVLKQRISKRLLKRKVGMIKEAYKLHADGLSWKRMQELGLEYKYLAHHLKGKITEKEMIETLESKIWQYAKRQRTWFRRNKSIKWFVPTEIVEIDGEIRKFLK